MNNSGAWKVTPTMMKNMDSNVLHKNTSNARHEKRKRHALQLQLDNSFLELQKVSKKTVIIPKRLNIEAFASYSDFNCNIQRTCLDLGNTKIN